MSAIRGDIALIICHATPARPAAMPSIESRLGSLAHGLPAPLMANRCPECLPGNERARFQGGSAQDRPGVPCRIRFLAVAAIQKLMASHRKMARRTNRTGYTDARKGDAPTL